MNTTATNKNAPLQCGVCGKNHRIGTQVLNTHLQEYLSAKLGTFPVIARKVETIPPVPAFSILRGNMGQLPDTATQEAIKALAKQVRQYPAAPYKTIGFEELTLESKVASFEAILAEYKAKIASAQAEVDADNSNAPLIAEVTAHNVSLAAQYNNIVAQASYHPQAFKLTISTERPIDGNWTNASRSLPRIPEIKQEERAVQVYTRDGYSSEYPARCEATTALNEDWSEDGRVCKLYGSVDVRNFRHGKVGGSMNFVYFVFQGDDNRIYAHRATATDAWYNLPPAEFYAKIRRYKTAVQQGDMLFVPANGEAKSIKFEHEVSNFGEHKLEFPVLAAQGYIKVDSPIQVTHRTHPTITLTPHVYRVTTTAESLTIPQHTRID